MDIIIVFFRDILDGPIYIVVAVISLILICSCIGYLAEKSINKKKEKQKYASVENNYGPNSVSNFEQIPTVPTAQTVQTVNVPSQAPVQVANPQSVQVAGQTLPQTPVQQAVPVQPATVATNQPVTAQPAQTIATTAPTVPVTNTVPVQPQVTKK